MLLWTGGEEITQNQVSKAQENWLLQWLKFPCFHHFCIDTKAITLKIPGGDIYNIIYMNGTTRNHIGHTYKANICSSFEGIKEPKIFSQEDNILSHDHPSTSLPLDQSRSNQRNRTSRKYIFVAKNWLTWYWSLARQLWYLEDRLVGRTD